MARKKSRTRQRVGLVQKQNLNAPGGQAEFMANALQGVRGAHTGAMGPDPKLRDWTFGLGHELIANPQKTVQMAPMDQSEWQDVGIKPTDVTMFGAKPRDVIPEPKGTKTPKGG